MARPRVRDEFRRETTTIRLPNWLLIWLLRQDESSGVVIERALVSHYKVKPPDSE